MSHQVIALAVAFVFVGLLYLLAYLAACAGSERWLTWREWWGGKFK
jgi:hypothetical protein